MNIYFILTEMELIMQNIEDRIIKYGTDNPNGVVPIKAAKGHFATTHSHINYYIDLTTLKSRSSEAKQAAKVLAGKYMKDTMIDTIVCMDGTMVLGAYLADYLAQEGIPSSNLHQTVYIVEPEYSNSSQLIFRDNIFPMIQNKNVLLLMATISSGISFTKGIRCINYYGGKTVGLASIFSTLTQYDDMSIQSLYTPADIPDYHAYNPIDCPMCQAGEKVEAFVNAYGYSQILQTGQR